MKNGVERLFGRKRSVALFTNQQPLTERATNFIEAALPELIVSDFAGAEFASAIAQRVRGSLATFDARIAEHATAPGVEVVGV